VVGQNKKKKVPRVMLVFFCIPVGPGRSRVIWAFPRNIGVWLHHITPRWLYHVGQNLVLDSDIFLLHVEVHNSSSVSVRHNKHPDYTLLDLSHTQSLVIQAFVTLVC